ncbi:MULTISPECIES: glutamate racemase [Halomonas]|uniref:Glutamate racemase n=2 Tax=Halomonas TaxID=2745 RepID=A0A7X4VWX6_9GAMM|nr:MULTISPECIES: glutamate racemase [Halomonas]MDR5901486.1 glutamate racemase [Halomonas icarae]NAW11766.1 glutamate racemase [Halomonas icarae]TDB00812.1 glutamate racemase [Halomonas marinisediminis]
MAGPILVFDSGVGGLSVVAALRARMPHAALAYACDNAMLPYGRRQDAWLVERILAVCEAAVAASRCAALVVACNTASTLALDALREHLRVPVVGTVPAIKPAAMVSRSRHIGLLATSATVARPYTLRLIETFAADCRVRRVAADPLVREAERYLAGELPDSAVIASALAPLWEEPELDTVVLGCTHFPLLRDLLSAAAPRAVSWVDSSDAIARRTAQVASDVALGSGPGQSFASAPDMPLAGVLSRFGFSGPRPLALG